MYMYVEIKQFFKEDVLIYQWHLHNMQGSRVVYILKSVVYLIIISNHIFVYINHLVTFYYDYKWCAQWFIKFTDAKTETESTNWGRVYLYHVLIGEAAF